MAGYITSTPPNAHIDGFLDRLLARGITDLVGRDRNGGLWLLREGRAALSVDQEEYYPGGDWGGDWSSVVAKTRAATRVVLIPISQSDVDDQDTSR